MHRKYTFISYLFIIYIYNPFGFRSYEFILNMTFHYNINAHVPGVLQVGQKYARVSDKHLQRTVKTTLTLLEMHYLVVVQL